MMYDATFMCHFVIVKRSNRLSLHMHLLLAAAVAAAAAEQLARKSHY